MWQRRRGGKAAARDAMLSVVSIGAHSLGEANLMTDWVNAGATLDTALVALHAATGRFGATR